MKPTKEQIEFMKPGRRVLCGHRGGRSHRQMMDAIKIAIENPDKRGVLLVPDEAAKAGILRKYGDIMPENLIVITPPFQAPGKIETCSADDPPCETTYYSPKLDLL